MPAHFPASWSGVGFEDRDALGVVVVIAHRPSALAAVDQVLVMGEGRIQSFGEKESVLGKVLRQSAPAAVPLKIVTDGVGSR